MKRETGNQEPETRTRYVLGIETATRVGGVAIAGESGVVVSLHVNMEQSHSRLTASLVAQALDAAGIKAGDLAAVAVSIGPGSFTGVRIGLSLAKGLCLAVRSAGFSPYLQGNSSAPLSIRAEARTPNGPEARAKATTPGMGPTLIGVSTLEAIATRAGQAQMAQAGVLVSPILDARRGEVYAALFRAPADANGPVIRLHDDDRCHLDEWLKRLGPAEDILFAGEAESRFGEIIASRLGARARFASPLIASPSADAIAWIALRRLREDPDCGRNWETMEPEYVHGSTQFPTLNIQQGTRNVQVKKDGD